MLILVPSHPETWLSGLPRFPLRRRPSAAARVNLAADIAPHSFAAAPPVPAATAGALIIDLKQKISHVFLSTPHTGRS